MLPLANAAGLTLEAHGDGWALADRDLLEQVLIGLVGNGIKHTPSGGTIELRVGGAEGRVTIGVSDTGGGIATRDLAHVFDRFWRAPAARGMPGSGLGLSIVRQVAEAHGGTVTAELPHDGGTLMRLRLPTQPTGAS